MKFLIVTGMSGGGKSKAVDCLEDMGFYCVDIGDLYAQDLHRIKWTGPFLRHHIPLPVPGNIKCQVRSLI